MSGIVQIPQVILHAVHGRGDFRPTEVFVNQGGEFRAGYREAMKIG